MHVGAELTSPRPPSASDSSFEHSPSFGQACLASNLSKMVLMYLLHHQELYESFRNSGVEEIRSLQDLWCLENIGLNMQ